MAGSYGINTDMGGGGGGINPWSTGIQLGTGLLGLISGQGAAKKQSDILGYQRKMAREQFGAYNTALPQYQSALERYGQDIGLTPGGPQGYGNSGQQYRGGTIGMHAGVAPGQTATYTNQFTPGADNGYLMGPYAQQAYRLRSAANQQNLEQQTQNQDQNLMFQAQQHGLASGSAMAALAREHQGLLQDYANSQRQLAINAGPAEQQQLAGYMGAISPMLGQGSQGLANAENLSGVYGQQAQAGFGAAGQTINNWMQQQQMRQYLDQMQQNGGGYGAGNPFYSAMNYGGSGYGIGR